MQALDPVRHVVLLRLEFSLLRLLLEVHLDLVADLVLHDVRHIVHLHFVVGGTAARADDRIGRGKIGIRTGRGIGL